jgi:hypothetical protein
MELDVGVCDTLILRVSGLMTLQMTLVETMAMMMYVLSSRQKCMKLELLFTSYNSPRPKVTPPTIHTRGNILNFM